MFLGLGAESSVDRDRERRLGFGRVRFEEAVFPERSSSSGEGDSESLKTSSSPELLVREVGEALLLFEGGEKEGRLGPSGKEESGEESVETRREEGR